MDRDPTNTGLDERTRRDLARLADGSLQGRPRAELETRVVGSPSLGAALERQRAGAAALRGLALEAPLSLRAAIGAEAATRARPPAARRRFALPAALAGGLAAAALAVVLVLQGGSTDPTVPDAAQLAELPATQSVAADRSNPKLLAASVEGVPFPDFSGRFGWRAAGSRSDRLAGREARTVAYEHDGRRIAYTIVSGPGIAAPAEATTTRRNGVDLHLFREGGRRVVTWWRDGRTCVLSASGVGSQKLLGLASWKGDGAVPF
jgi:hypothetical protein